MSDEEKKDILFQIDMQLYAEFNDKFCEMNDNLGTIYTYKDIDDLEKLEKETEIKLLRKAIKKQSKEIEEAEQKEKKGYIKGYIDGTNIADKLCNEKWERKIKAKIEEVEQWELYNMKIPKLSTLDERLGAKIGIKYVLHSLLEKE